METDFTPLASLAGGALIGLAAVALMALQGRILGATGILTGFFAPQGRDDWTWRAAFLLGVIMAPLAYHLLTGSAVTIDVPVSTPMLVGGGLLVGLGVAWGNGCTSGHGVCGMARLSPRSIAATLTFLGTAIATVFVLRHVIGA